jgi:hypothetical protein
MVAQSRNLPSSKRRTGKDEDKALVVLYPQGGHIFTSVDGKLRCVVSCELINNILLGIHTTTCSQHVQLQQCCYKLLNSREVLHLSPSVLDTEPCIN